MLFMYKAYKYTTKRTEEKRKVEKLIFRVVVDTEIVTRKSNKNSLFTIRTNRKVTFFFYG